MRGFIKTLVGDGRNLMAAGLCIGFAILLLHSPLAMLAGIALPVALLAGAAYVAKH
jgi:hypothetical protein